MRLPFSPVKMLAAVACTLMLVYVALIAVTVNYAALTVEFAQSVRNDEAAIATLESSYFSILNEVNKTDYTALGYTKPLAQKFVQSAPATALR